MSVTCFIQYKIDPDKISEFEAYATQWADIIPACGGDLIGYFLPYESSNNIAYGIVIFNSLACYEAYRSKLKRDPEGSANFAFARKHQFIIEESRFYLRPVESTLWRTADKPGE